MHSFALIVAVPLAACSVSDGDTGDRGIAATGTGTSRSYAVADFTGVALRGSDDVDVRVGTGFAVTAEGSIKELDRLRITRHGDTLEVGRMPGAGISWGGHDKVVVHVTMPRITSGATAGSGNLRIDRVDGPAFAGSVAGSGDLAIGALTVREAKLSIAGSGDVSASGTVTSLVIDVAGSGDVKADNLKASGATVAVAGSGGVKAAVAGAATVNLSGSGDIDLGPAARCTTSKSGSGSVRCG